ncbi:hypothetical protein J437_LFUL001252 [Ladona fulva]|uniref:Reverse transcriptase domain-containing protein n=1 Tax=Ladona fulva TaxID=123851 RepID=A0A8K0JW12_LADFU|nr:hypothetical protein J437_LFUL001252 [Ladona fulva]
MRFPKYDQTIFIIPRHTSHMAYIFPFDRNIGLVVPPFCIFSSISSSSTSSLTTSISSSVVPSSSPRIADALLTLLLSFLSFFNIDATSGLSFESALASTKSAYWWTEEIAELRRNCLKLRRKAQRARRGTKGIDYSSEHKSARKELRIAIKRSKFRCWKALCDEVNADPWGLGYKIATQKLGALGSVGTMTVRVMQKVVDELFPTHPLRTDSESEIDDRYTDNIAAVIEARNPELAQLQLNQVMRRVNAWMENHSLNLAFSKTEIVMLTRKRICTITEMRVGSEITETKVSARYLGVEFDSKLTFWPQIKKSSDKAAAATVSLSRLMANVGGPKQCKRKLLMAVVESQLLYGAEIWAKYLSLEKKIKPFAMEIFKDSTQMKKHVTAKLKHTSAQAITSKFWKIVLPNLLMNILEQTQEMPKDNNVYRNYIIKVAKQGLTTKGFFTLHTRIAFPYACARVKALIAPAKFPLFSNSLANSKRAAGSLPAALSAESMSSMCRQCKRT